MKIPETMPENFCLLPFKSTRQTPMGKSSPCAFGAGEWFQAHLTPMERWHSPELNDLRQEFIDGKKPASCRRCWEEEAAGKESPRQLHLKLNPTEYSDFIQSGKWINGPNVGVFKTSNICNLACRSCGPWDTSMYNPEGKFYNDEYNTTVLYQGQIHKHNRFVSYDPRKHTDFKPFFEMSHNLKHVSFFGGEPFLNTTHLDLLDYMIQNNLSSETTLFYSTNVTQIPSERIVKAWENFKAIEVSFSVDGLEEAFEYTRWPAKWSELLKVIAHFKNIRNNLNRELKLVSSVTVSTINCYEVDKIYDWHQDSFGKCYVNLVPAPDYLVVNILPEKIKNAMKQKVKNADVLGFMDIHPSDKLKFKQFIIWMKRQDLYRKQSFEKTYPEYHALFADEWNSITDLSHQNFTHL